MTTLRSDGCVFNWKYTNMSLPWQPYGVTGVSSWKIYKYVITMTTLRSDGCVFSWKYTNMPLPWQLYGVTGVSSWKIYKYAITMTTLQNDGYVFNWKYTNMPLPWQPYGVTGVSSTENKQICHYHDNSTEWRVCLQLKIYKYAITMTTLRNDGCVVNCKYTNMSLPWQPYGVTGVSSTANIQICHYHDNPTEWRVCLQLKIYKYVITMTTLRSDGCVFNWKYTNMSLPWQPYGVTGVSSTENIQICHYHDNPTEWRVCLHGKYTNMPLPWQPYRVTGVSSWKIYKYAITMTTLRSDGFVFNWKYTNMPLPWQPYGVTGVSSTENIQICHYHDNPTEWRVCLQLKIYKYVITMTTLRSDGYVFMWKYTNMPLPWQPYDVTGVSSTENIQICHYHDNPTEWRVCLQLKIYKYVITMTTLWSDGCVFNWKYTNMPLPWQPYGVTGMSSSENIQICHYHDNPTEWRVCRQLKIYKYVITITTLRSL